LDVAGGSGVFGKAFLKVFPDAKVIQVDWPVVNAVARKNNAEYVEQGRFKTMDGDLFETPWEQEGPFDVVILSHIIHQEDVARTKTLIRRIGHAMHEDSEIIINEFAVNEPKNYPPYSLIFGLSMVLQNAGGGVYSYSDFNEMLSVVNHDIYLVSSPVPPSTLYFSRVKKTSGKPTKALKSVQTKGDPSAALGMTGKDLGMTGKDLGMTGKDLGMTGKAPTSFLDAEWDTADTKIREQWLMERFHEQLCYAKKHSNHWKKRLSEFIIETSPLTRVGVETLPVFFKSELRILNPFDLTADSSKVWHVVRASGGTTGAPTTLLWTENDWRAAIETSVRFVNRICDWSHLRVWNGYNQAHVAGPAFDDIIRLAGGTPVPRHFKSSDREAIQEMEHLKVNAMVLTPKSGSGKGGSLEDFLAIDPNFISRIGIKHLWVSSTNLDKSLLKELKSLGVESITNFYGSTESMPVAISCSADPLSFHMCQGHVLLEVLDDNGKHVKSGKRGTVLVSRIGSSKGESIGPAEGTQLFRFVMGDSAVYHDEACSCGLKTPRISELQRLPLEEEKIMGGCERWD